MSDVVVPILMYHKVAPVNPRSTLKGHYVPPQLFARQMDALARRNFQVVGLSSLFEADLSKKPVVITFDDGYENFYSEALPILKRHNFSATVFLVANAIGGTNNWDSRLGDVEEKLMTVDQIRSAQSQGIEFGSHTLDHSHLDQLDHSDQREREEAWQQIEGSKKLLESSLQSEISTFCYPYGGKNEEVKAMVQRAGYRLACSTEKGANTRLTDRFALRRTNIRRDTNVPIFLYKIIRDVKEGG